MKIRPARRTTKAAAERYVAMMAEALRSQQEPQLTWVEVDLEGAMWRISGERTKNARAHEVQLSQPALEILGTRRRCVGRALVFGSRGPFSGWSKAKASLDARMSAALGGCAPASWRLHDIRRTVATRLADLGVLPQSSRWSSIMPRVTRRASQASIIARSMPPRSEKRLNGGPNTSRV